MQKIIAFLFCAFCTSRAVFGAEPTRPPFPLPDPGCRDGPLAIDSIAPQDVVQESIKVRRMGTRMGTNDFAVFFTYTEAGAKKMLDFSEAHAGQKMHTRVGDFLSPEGVCYAPRDPADYAKWREGWLKRRTSKFYGVSEADAEAIVAGLKEKPRR